MPIPHTDSRLGVIAHQWTKERIKFITKHQTSNWSTPFSEHWLLPLILSITQSDSQKDKAHAVFPTRALAVCGVWARMD